MKKLLFTVPILFLLVTGVFALTVFQENYKAKGGTLNYIGDDTTFVMSSNSPNFEFDLKKNPSYSVNSLGAYKVRGNLRLRATNQEGKRIVLSISFKDLAQIYENSATRTYVKIAGRVRYWEKGIMPKSFNSRNIRIDINKNTGLINIAGLEETDYKFRITGMIFPPKLKEEKLVCKIDINQDGMIDISDLSILLGNYRKAVKYNIYPGNKKIPVAGQELSLIRSDIDKSGRVGRRDLNELIEHYGESIPECI